MSQQHPADDPTWKACATVVAAATPACTSTRLPSRTRSQCARLRTTLSYRTPRTPDLTTPRTIHVPLSHSRQLLSSSPLLQIRGWQRTHGSDPTRGPRTVDGIDRTVRTHATSSNTRESTMSANILYPPPSLSCFRCVASIQHPKSPPSRELSGLLVLTFFSSVSLSFFLFTRPPFDLSLSARCNTGTWIATASMDRS